MAKELDGRVALVTGASSGIGEATAEALAAAGAKVVVAARRIDRLQQVVERIGKAGGEAAVIEADVTQPRTAEAMIADTQKRFGKLDILVNNAGVMLLAPIEAASPEDWRRMIDVNLLGLMYATHAAIPVMKPRGGGHIVNISSVAGRVAFPDSAVYSATKFGVGAFSESLRREVFRHRIRVTVIEPGFVETELREHIPDAATRERIDHWAESMRQLTARDVAAAILYAVTQPDHVNVAEILIRPVDQEL